MAMQKMSATNGEKYECAKRELAQRERVYPRLIESGKMTKEFAATQIRLMAEIADDYRKLYESEMLL
jgi:hypothetical protein